MPQAAPATSAYQDNLRLPLFYVPQDKKTQKLWAQQMLNFVSGSNVLSYSRPRRDLYQRYFDLFNGVFNMADYKYVWATFGDVKPMTFTNYPLLYPIINSIVGNFLKQPLDFEAHKVNPNAVSERLHMEAEMLFLQLAKPYWDKFTEKTGMQLELDERMNVLPDNVKEYFTYDFRDLEERVVKDGMTYIMMKHDQKSEQARMLYDQLITGDFFYKIEYVDGDPMMRRIDPRTAIVDRGVDDFIYKILDKNLDYFFEELYLTPSEVLYRYEHYMTAEDKETFKSNIEAYLRYGDRRMWNTSWCRYYYVDKEGLRVRCLDGQWLARNRMEFPKEFNEATGEATKEASDIMDVWEGVKIGHDIYVKLQRKKNILRNGDNYRQAQLDYGGVISKFGIFDKSYHLQMLYNIVMSHIEFAINQAGGKATVIDTSKIPMGDDGHPKYTVDDMIYMAKVQGVIPMFSQEGDQYKDSQGNFTQLDFGMSPTINNLILFKQMIEQTASRMTGVSPDALGFTSPYQAVRVTESNISQGSATLAPLYYVHSKGLEAGMQKMADLMKIVWAKNDIRAYVVGDMGMHTIQLTDKLSLSDYGIFLRNTMADAEAKQLIMQAYQQAMAVDPTLIKEMIKTYNSNSAVEAEKIISQSVDYMRAQQQQKLEQEAQAQQQAAIAAQQMANDKMQQLKDNNETALKGKQITADSVVQGKLIEQDTALQTTEMKTRNVLDQTQLKAVHGEQIEKIKVKNKPKPTQKKK